MRIEKKIIYQVIDQLNYTNVKKPGHLAGLCQEIHKTGIRCGILRRDLEKFTNWFTSQKPSKTMNKQFYLPERKDNSLYWWPKGEYSVRLKFLQHLLQKRIR